MTTSAGYRGTAGAISHEGYREAAVHQPDESAKTNANYPGGTWIVASNGSSPKAGIVRVSVDLAEATRKQRIASVNDRLERSWKR